MNYADWEHLVPEYVRQDVLWKVQAYRLSLFLLDISWSDTGKLTNRQQTRTLADQLYRSVGSISANIAEGYSRSSGRDRARFYEYALGSAREARNWYYAGRHVLSEPVVAHRCEQLTSIIRLILTHALGSTATQHP